MEVVVKHQEHKQFLVGAEKHECVIDLSAEKGGTEKGMSPAEAFLGSLGACIAVYARIYLENAKIAADGFSVKVVADISSDKPLRFAKINAEINLGVDLGNRKQSLLNFIKNCPVHNTLVSKPEINISVEH